LVYIALNSIDHDRYNNILLTNPSIIQIIYYILSYIVITSIILYYSKSIQTYILTYIVLLDRYNVLLLYSYLLQCITYISYIITNIILYI